MKNTKNTIFYSLFSFFDIYKVLWDFTKWYIIETINNNNINILQQKKFINKLYSNITITNILKKKPKKLLKYFVVLFLLLEIAVKIASKNDIYVSSTNS